MNEQLNSTTICMVNEIEREEESWKIDIKED
jgi:hypothetical protein